MLKTTGLKKTFKMLKRNVVLIVAVTFVVMLLGVLYAKLFVAPLYTSSVEVMVKTDSDDEINSNSNVEITSRELTSTCIAFMNNDVVLQKVTESTGGKYTVSQVRSMLSFEQIDDSMFVKIIADTASPDDSRHICVAVAEYTKLAVQEATGVDYIEIIGTANTPVAASSSDVVVYGIIGAVIGLCVSIAILCIYGAKYNKIKNKNTIRDHFDIPVLGEIPSFDTDN